MSLPITAPSANEARATEARQVSTETGASKRATRPVTTGTTRSSSSASETSGPGPAFTPPMSRMSAPSATSCSARRVELVELERGALVVERVRGAVENPHHERTMRQVVAATTEIEGGGERGARLGVGARRPGGRRRHQNSRAASARRYSLVRGSSAPIASRRSTNSWRAASSSRTRSSSSSSFACISSRPMPCTSTPASRRRASAAECPAGLGLGKPLQEGQRLGGLTAVDEDAGEPLGGGGVVWLELERRAQGGLVPGRGQRVRLARSGRQPLDERGDLGLGQRSDELVHHLAVADGEDGGDRLHVEGLRHRRVVVDVDLGQLDRTPGVRHRLLEHGAQGLAGPAPRGPEVHDHRHCRAAVQHVGLKGLVCHVHRPRR